MKVLAFARHNERGGRIPERAINPEVELSLGRARAPKQCYEFPHSSFFAILEAARNRRRANDEIVERDDR